MRRITVNRRFRNILGGALVAAVWACADGASDLTGPEPGLEQGGRITVTNDRAVLAARVHYAGNVQLVIDPSFGGMTLSEGVTFRRAPKGVSASVGLGLRAVVDPPELDGTTLQATHITMRKDNAYVSYNAQGPLFRGGVDVFNTVQPERTELISQALLSDTDVNALDSKDGRLYMATATEDPQFTSGAVFEELELDGDLLTTNSRRVDLPSYAGTGVAADGGLVFATSGDGADGGVAALDILSLELVWRADFADARAVAIDGSTILTMAGQPGTLRVFDAGSGALNASYTPGGANIPHSKSTVAIQEGLAFVAAGDEGTKVVQLSDGTVTDVVPAPVVDGLDPSLTVTNAVAVSGNLVFMANGGAGLWVARLKLDELEVVGMIDFGDGPSVNFVAVGGNLLFAATGTGGLRIVEVNQGNKF